MGLWELTLMYFFLCESSTLPTTPATSSEDIFLQMTWLTDSKSKVHLKLPSPFPCHDNRQSQGIQQFPGNLPSSRGRQPNPGQTYLQNWKCCPREEKKDEKVALRILKNSLWSTLSRFQETVTRVIHGGDICARSQQKREALLVSLRRRIICLENL